MENVFAKIWGGMKFIGVHVADGFKKLFGEQAAKDFAKASLELLKSASGQIVLQAVAALMNIQTLSGPQKQVSAFTTACESLGQAGIKVGEQIAASEVNLLIELAVNSLKGTLAPVTVPNLPDAPEPAV